MTDAERLAAISVNLLRMSERYFKDPVANAAVCQRFLDQSVALASDVRAPKTQARLQTLRSLSLRTDEPPARTAERFLTLGVLLQHPERWLE